MNIGSGCWCLMLKKSNESLMKEIRNLKKRLEKKNKEIDVLKTKLFSKRIDEILPEKAFDKVQEAIRLLLHTSEDIISIYDIKGTILYIHKAESLNFDDKELIGKNINEIFDPETSSKLLEQMRIVAETKRSNIFENKINFL